ncbi:hypothetical protein, partial [Gorillibacterium massiliense]|uniref:hypothetical protein n=1 Tax=Gorillibacterium massiliense TaxID=1280390 RepID=UPI00059354CE
MKSLRRFTLVLFTLLWFGGVIVGGLGFRTATVFASSGGQLIDQPVGSFEAASENWSTTLGGEFPGATGTFVRDTADPHYGGYSERISADFTAGGRYVGISRGLPSLDAQELDFWIKSADINQIEVRMIDNTGQTHQQRINLTSTPDWQSVSVTKFNGGTDYTHFGGTNDGVWHGPAKQIWLIIESRSIVGGGKTV